jgi:probable F420-dependent oxidoreductase
MRFGIITPVLTRLPRAHARWEVDAGIAEVAEIARAAERLGFSHLTCSEHVAVPETVAPVRGATYWDPLSTFGYLAAVTERIRLATFVLVLGYHHPLAIVKRYGTLDRICGGRLILGLGVGSLREEFELLGAPFEGRGAAADDAIAAIRAAWGRPVPAYRGTHYSFEGFVVDPTAPRTDVPVWIGGRTARSLRRAVELAEGWAPFGLAPERIAAMLTRARDTEAWDRRAAPLEVILWADPPVDPAGDPAGAAAALGRLAEAGATVANLRVVHHSFAHYMEQLEATTALDVFTPA